MGHGQNSNKIRRKILRRGWGGGETEVACKTVKPLNFVWDVNKAIRSCRDVGGLIVTFLRQIKMLL